MEKQISKSVLIQETDLSDDVLRQLIDLSGDWAKENSCYGYRANELSDIEENRIFVAEEGSAIIGYLFGHKENSEKASSIMPNGTSFFEVEELYVKPEYRSRGIGQELFSYVEATVSEEAEFIMLSTATKNWKAIFHFYLEECGMEFWSARLYKKI